MNDLSQFERWVFEIEGFHYMLPSDRMLVEVLATFPDEQSEADLLRRSNIFVTKVLDSKLHNPDYLSYLKLWESIFLRLALPFPTFAYHQLCSEWYDCLAMPEVHKGREIYDFHVDTLAFIEEGQMNFTRMEAMAQRAINFDKNHPLNRFSEYKRAKNVVDFFTWQVFQVGKSDEVIESQFDTIFRMNHAASLKNLNEHLSGMPSSTVCQFCGKIFSYTLGRGVNEAPLHCGTTECKKEYERLRKQEQRAFAPGKFEVAHRGSNLVCDKCYESRKRTLNKNRWCRKCFSETQTE